jgi:plasmid stability protein
MLNLSKMLAGQRPSCPVPDQEMETPMSDMLIRNIPELLKREIEQAARKSGQSLSGKAIALLREGMVAERQARLEPGLSAWDAIRATFAAENAIGDEFAKTMNEIEAERKRDFGRRPAKFATSTEPT